LPSGFLDHLLRRCLNHSRRSWLSNNNRSNDRRGLDAG
jgi:hypothetical protein